MMLRAVLVNICFVATISLAGTVQVPLHSSHGWPDASQTIHSDDGLAEWNLNQPTNPNDTDHLVFETVHSLLQRWPNTRMRNGHNIVPGIIPKGILLYHAKEDDDESPLAPWWLATEPEHSHVICTTYLLGDSPQGTCRLLTFVTTRPLKVVYFDGSSAANMPNGTADTQELLAWGTTRGGTFEIESPMMQDLCEWGRDFGMDGLVRMEMDFEVVLCDSTSGLSLVSSVSIKMRDTDPSITIGLYLYEVIEAGSWHNRFPGETRVQLDLAGLVSFYDTQLVPSLVPIRADQERWDHRVQNTSSRDLLAVESRLKTALTRPSDISRDIDWRTLIQVIVDRFAGRLELMRHLLTSSAANPSDLLDLAKKTQTQLRTTLTPYILFSVRPIDPSDQVDLAWASRVYKLCATTYTSFVDPKSISMTDSEKLILRAVRGTSREICRVVTKMWAAGVYAGLDGSLNTKSSPDIAEVTHVWNTWGGDLDRLMRWLDWSVWVKCDPRCGPGELCYLPTWPVGVDPGHPWSHSGRPTSFNEQTMSSEERRKPEPRCISRSAPPDSE